MEPERPAGSSRESLLPLMLTFMTLGGFLLFLILVSGGFFLYVVAGVFGLFFVVLLHYVTWGATLTQQTEGEREEERLREETEENIW
jgi:hypothetical protein